MGRKRKGERADGLIQICIDVGRDVNGKRIRKYFYGHTRAEAERKRDLFKAHMAGGSTYGENITVAEWIEIFKSTYRGKVNNAYLDIDDVPYNRLTQAIGYMRMVDVTEIHLQTALNAVANMSFSTVTKYKYAITRVFTRARANKIIPDNPAENLIMPPYTKGTHRALDAWEIDLILKHWSDDGVRGGLWILLMLLAGLRRGEMMALEWSAIDMTARNLSVRQVAVSHGNKLSIEQRAKTDAGLRTIPLCRALFDALDSIPESERNGYVCKSAKGLPLTETAVLRGVQHFCDLMTRIANGECAAPRKRVSRTEQAAYEARRNSPEYVTFNLRCHDLRHTFATALYDAGVPVKAAQYFLGHSDVKMTLALYTHLSKERETASAKQMVEFFDALLDERSNTVKFPFFPE